MAFTNENPDVSVSEKYYRQVFRKYFPHLRFQRPRQDTCSTCDLFQNKIKAGKGLDSLRFIKEHELHLRKAEKATKLMYAGMKEAREPNSEVCVMSMDLEKVLFVPTLTHS